MLSGFKRIINDLKCINKEYIFLFLIILLVGFLLYSATSISQAPEEITLTCFYPAPFGEYNEILVKRVVDYDNPGTYFLDPSGESTMCKIRLLAVSAATTDLGSLTIDGKIYGTSTDNYYVDLNFAPTSPDIPTGNEPAGIYINSIRTKSYIFMGAMTPGSYDPPLTGKHVYDISEGMMVGDCEPGDVMLISPDNDQMLVRSSKRFDSAIAGVISESPKLYLGALPDRKPVALAGIVKCKVTAENGPIKRGDLLVTSSEPGYAMRVEPNEVKPGVIVGSALEPMEQGKAQIYILVN